jgi:hypothetical protein
MEGTWVREECHRTAIWKHNSRFPVSYQHQALPAKERREARVPSRATHNVRAHSRFCESNEKLHVLQRWVKRRNHDTSAKDSTSFRWHKVDENMVPKTPRWDIAPQYLGRDSTVDII